MNSPTFNRNRLLELVDLYATDDITPAELAELEELLHSAEDARQTFGRYIQFEVGLAQSIECNEAFQGLLTAMADPADTANLPDALTPSCRPVAVGSPIPADVWGRAKVWLRKPEFLSVTVAALVIVSAILTLAVMYLPQRTVSQPSTNAPLVPVARLTAVYNAQWAIGQTGVRPGAHLPEGHRMELNKGLAEVTFRKGARVTIEGPATLRLDGTGAAALKSGKLVAFVPAEASGFSIHTRNAVITDLGTEFGLVVGEDGATDVYVHQGQVLVEGNNGEQSVRKLAAQQSLRITPDGQIADLDHRPDFVYDIRLRGGRGKPIPVAGYTYVGDSSDPKNARHDNFNPYDDGAQKLIDGEFGSRVCSDLKWVGWFDRATLTGGDQGVPQPSVLFDLGEPAEITSLQISYAVEHQNGIHAPDRVVVFVSNDGRSFAPVVESNDFDDTWTFTGSPVVGRAIQRTAAVELVGVNSRFIRLDFYSDDQWTFLSEVVFLGGP